MHEQNSAKARFDLCDGKSHQGNGLTEKIEKEACNPAQ